VGGTGRREEGDFRKQAAVKSRNTFADTVDTARTGFWPVQAALFLKHKGRKGTRNYFMNATEIRMLNSRNEQRGWLEVPDTCPPIFAAKIAEMRSANLKRRKDQEVWTFDTAIPGAPHHVEVRSASAPAARVKQVCLEERYRQQTGRVYVSDHDLRMKLANLSAQVEADRRTLDAENERAARNAAIVRNECFPWEN
jgi:hypothetical protein